MSEIRFPDWFEPKPFNIIPFSSQLGTTNYIQLEKRMRQALAGVASITGESYNLLPYNDRLGISVPFGWASELIPEFESHQDNVKEYITFYIWPGNTKTQGYSIFNKSLDWVTKPTLTVDGSQYELEIVYNIKLCHFNRYVAGINFYETDILKLLHTSDNFYNQSGKWDSDSWGKFEKLMDKHFKPEFNWRKQCDWQNKFLNTDRSYFTMSLGFQVAVYIPFSKFKTLDKKEDDIKNVSKFISQIATAYQILI